MKRYLFSLILFLALIINAFSSNLEINYEEVHVKAGGNIGIIAFLENNTSTKQCYEFYTYTSNEKISATLGTKEICLNSYERTKFSITISSKENTPIGNYWVDLEVVGRENLVKRVYVKVERIDTIEFDLPEDITICKEDYSSKVEVEVINLGEETEEVFLNAESPIFLPYFEESKTRIRTNSSKKVNLVINMPTNVKEGSYSFNIYASTTNNFVQRKVDFEIISCEETKDELEVYLREYIEINKESSGEISLKIVNNSEETKNVKISLIGDLPNEHPAEINIGPNEQRYLDLVIKARKSDEGGLHIMKLYVWDSEEIEERDIRVYVRKVHDITIDVLNKVTIENCDISKGIVEIKLSNKGDYEETIDLSVENISYGISYTFSEDRINLKKYEEKIVYLILHAAYDAEIGNKKAYVIARASGMTYRAEFEYEVIKANIVEDQEEGLVYISSYPFNVEIIQGEEEKFSITVRNNSDKDLLIDITAESPSGIYLIIPQENVNKRSEKTIKGKVLVNENVKEGEYKIKLKLKANGFYDEKEIDVRITKPAYVYEKENKEENKIFAALFTMASAIISDKNIMLLIIAISILIIGYLLLLSDKNKTAYLYEKVNGGV